MAAYLSPKVKVSNIARIRRFASDTAPTIRAAAGSSNWRFANEAH